VVAENGPRDVEHLGGQLDSQPTSTAAPQQVQILDLLAKINAAVAAANEAEQAVTTAQGELVSRSRTVGLLLLEAKKLHPAVKDFEALLKKVQGLQLSRAYDCMRIAGGRTTDEEIRKATRERVKKHRDKKKLPPAPEPRPISVTSTPVTESAEASAERRKAENANLGMTAAARSKQYLQWFAAACRGYLPQITVEIHRQEARRLFAELMKAEAA
jgi:hypothetical protein